jgi:hypothetical protein
MTPDDFPSLDSPASKHLIFNLTQSDLKGIILITPPHPLPTSVTIIRILTLQLPTHNNNNPQRDVCGVPSLEPSPPESYFPHNLHVMYRCNDND